MTITDPRAFLTALFHAAVHAANPLNGIRQHLPKKPKGRTVVIGAGKGSAQMAAAMESCWDGPLEGLVVTRYGFSAPCKTIEIIEASHPVPDAAGLDASKRLLDLVRGLTEDDLVIALISGGGSALLPAPAGTLTLEDEIAVNRALLASGAPISAMNTIRKHLSDIKGGRLALAAWPAKVVSLVVSDIPGDDPALVASGPTVAGKGTRAEALDLIQLYNIELPASVMAHIATTDADAPSVGDPRFERNEVHLIASAGVSLSAAAEEAGKWGVEAAILSDAIEGEAREAAHVHAAIAREIRNNDRPFAKPIVLLSGGETTVTIAGKGKGGRNSEFLLSLAIDIDGYEGIEAMAADTDGIDGSEDNAGAFANGSTASRMRAASVIPTEFLKNNDAWSAFNAVGDLFVPGPTGTNVNDLRAILIQ